ncbi:hypothetical protein HaLaN_13917 [Haematococcus lacustris]|uniref:Uncharacterized protein n=1 Tax=Haematococcus lacustris TaxID=44745 RepID=A0A699ZDB6_HAELA|nr:hypothetical protein HaLaN_13917 [Haematococcus lacustris]
MVRCERSKVALIDFVAHVECLVGEEEMQSNRRCREVRRFLRQSFRLERGLLSQLMPSSTGKVKWIGGELKEPERRTSRKLEAMKCSQGKQLGRAARSSWNWHR